MDTIAWLLIAITIINSDGYVQNLSPIVSEHDTMEECFDARDDYLYNLGSTDGFPPVNTQAVCVRTDMENLYEY